MSSPPPNSNSDSDWINPEDLEFLEIQAHQSETPLQTYAYHNKNNPNQPPITLQTNLYPPFKSGDSSGCKLFDCEVKLSDFLVMKYGHIDTSIKKSLIEIGAGCTGLCGLCALNYLAGFVNEVCLQDFDGGGLDDGLDNSITLLESNIKHNTPTSSQSKLTLLNISWTNLKTSPNLRTYDYLIASEVLYESIPVSLLVSTISLLTNADSTVILSLPALPRVGDDQILLLNESMKSEGWVVEEVCVDGDAVITVYRKNWK